MLTSRRKNHKKQVGVCDGEEDRLSNLSEGIITYILSFLSTKESVRTSILSTRWKYIWSSVPTLDLRYQDFCTNAGLNFLNVIDRVLMGHSQHFLDKVHIDGDGFESHDGSHIEAWIHAAVKRNVCKSHLLNLDAIQPHDLHQSLFSYNALVVLKLHLGMVLNFPMQSTCFPNLKFLELDLVTYKDDTSAENLISGCPVLEDLVISRKENDNLQTLNVMSWPLKRLELRYIVLHNDEHIGTIVFDAPALESLDIVDDAMKLEYVVRDLSFIISVKLDVFNRCDMYSDNYVTCLYEQFIKRIFNVKFLRLSCSTMIYLSVPNSYDLPTFHNLTYLKFFDGDYDDYWDWKLVMEFLKSSPVLEVLIFDGFDFSHDGRGAPSELDVVQNCFTSHLKIIEIEGEVWGDCVENLKYFLKNAKVLEKLIIRSFKHENSTELEID